MCPDKGVLGPPSRFVPGLSPPREVLEAPRRFRFNATVSQRSPAVTLKGRTKRRAHSRGPEIEFGPVPDPGRLRSQDLTSKLPTFFRCHVTLLTSPCLS